MRSRYLVCYDIADPRRLARVFKLLKAQAIHVQYSVFCCSLTWNELGKLKSDLQERINPKEDDVRIYPLPAGQKVVVYGKGDRLPEGAELFIE